MDFINNDKFKWQEDKQQNSCLFFKGDRTFAIKMRDTARNNEHDLIPSLENTLRNQQNFTGGVIETDRHIVAWVDHIRTWALFYYHQDGTFTLSNCAHSLKDDIGADKYDQNAITEIIMSGYVTGKKTCVPEIASLAPGEFLIWDKKNKKLTIKKYFSYVPSFDSKISYDDAIKNLNDIFDHLIKKIIDRAQGKKIYIPLSGGLDSRFLLCKLLEHGYSNIETFTYGPRFNFEGLIAKKIARALNVPWRFVSIPKTKQKEYFNSQNRKDFWDFAGNLKVIPCMREYSAIRYLHENGVLDKDGIFLNGQSGDYITGGHLSTLSRDKKYYDLNDFYNVIIDKHYDLWQQYKTPQNLELVKQSIDALIIEETGQKPSISNNIEGATAEETWEYAGRQICYVANGQRVYEFFGYDWEMPLWEKELVDFYQPLPFDIKYGQKLYKEYLQNYNYKGLFPKKEPYIWRWPIPMLWIVPLAQIIGTIGGRKKKDSFYALMRYYGHYANQYDYFNWTWHKKTAQQARNVIALYAPQWLKEHHLKF